MAAPSSAPDRPEIASAAEQRHRPQQHRSAIFQNTASGCEPFSSC
jgi:hypothetical protein